MDVSWHFGVLNKKGVGATHYAKGEKAQVDTWPANGRKVDAHRLLPLRPFAEGGCPSRQNLLEKQRQWLMRLAVPPREISI